MEPSNRRIALSYTLTTTHGEIDQLKCFHEVVTVHNWVDWSNVRKFLFNEITINNPVEPVYQDDPYIQPVRESLFILEAYNYIGIK